MICIEKIPGRVLPDGRVKYFSDTSIKMGLRDVGPNSLLCLFECVVPA